MSKTEGNQVRGSDELSDEPEWSCAPLMTIRDPRKKYSMLHMAKVKCS